MKLKDALKYNEILENTINECKNDNDICLITKMPIKEKFTLPCNHVFEYDALLNNLLSTQSYYMKHSCPYCRSVFDGFLPYNNKTLIKFKPSLNTNKVFNTNKYLTCSYIFKSGKSKDTKCCNTGQLFNDNIYCFKHGKKYQESKDVLICKQILKNGNQCKFKCFDKEEGLCKRHYNIKNKNKVI